MDFEQIMMELLINAGKARSSAMMAIQCARKHDWPDADAAAKQAHKIQTQLIGTDEGQRQIAGNPYSGTCAGLFNECDVVSRSGGRTGASA